LLSSTWYFMTSQSLTSVLPHLDLKSRSVIFTALAEGHNLSLATATVDLLTVHDTKVWHSGLSEPLKQL
jgi:hypothetical protein